MKKFLWILAVNFIAVQVASAQPAQTPLFVAGQGGYHTYRIPALLVGPKGTLLAFCEGRKTSNRDDGDIDLLLRRSSDGGKTWGRQTVVHEEGGDAKITIGNPCPVVDQDTGTIWMTLCRDNRDVFVMHSKDEGATWSKPVDITKNVKKDDWGWYATGPGVGIQLKHGTHKGRLVIPCDHREPDPGQKVTHSHVIYSDDHGKTWHLGGTVAPNTNECQVVERPDGSLLMNMRNYWNERDQRKRRALATSEDGGQTWGKLTFDKVLIEPICQASLVRYAWEGKETKSLLLFANPAATDKRHQLTVRLSADEGRTWPSARVLESGPSAYSCLAALPDGSIGCLYERGEKNAYETIAFARFSLAWIGEGAK